jgi:hypothetical protein
MSSIGHTMQPAVFDNTLGTEKILQASIVV